MTADGERLARIPSVDAVLRLAGIAPLLDLHGRRPVADAVRAHLDRLRSRPELLGSPVDPEELVAAVDRSLRDAASARLRGVINATGVVLHTNLGRAPLSAAARAAVVEAAGYTNVEFDLVRGERGGRAAHAARVAAELCRAEDAVIVNNGAAALMLSVAALAAGREVIVSRGELVEIGGSFRLPEIVAASGARLVEVGTTNRTRIADYRAALGPETALVLKVHRSNFRLTGFTEEVGPDELAGLAADVGIPFAYDVGSGRLGLREVEAVRDEPSVREAVAAGADLVMFSGDKLLGGPQAGIVVGRRDPVGRCRAHPLMRAVRADKLQIAALEATLGAHLRSEDPEDVPVIAMLTADRELLRQRAEELVARVSSDVGDGSGGAVVRACSIDGVTGGGAAPDALIGSHGVMLDVAAPEDLRAALRAAAVPVIARVADDRVLLDLRTVAEESDVILGDVLVSVLRAHAEPAVRPQ